MAAAPEPGSLGPPQEAPPKPDRSARYTIRHACNPEVEALGPKQEGEVALQPWREQGKLSNKHHDTAAKGCTQVHATRV